MTSLLFKEISYDMGCLLRAFSEEKKKKQELLLYNILQMQSDVLCEVLNKEINNQL